MPREEKLMIHISLSETGYREVWIDLSGHADYAEKGKDIVCAAVSSLFFSTANGLMDFTKAKVEVYEKRYIDGRGGSMMHVQSLSIESDLLLKSMLSGMIELSKQYQDNIQIGKGVENFIKT